MINIVLYFVHMNDKLTKKYKLKKEIISKIEPKFILQYQIKV